MPWPGSSLALVNNNPSDAAHNRGAGARHKPSIGLCWSLRNKLSAPPPSSPSFGGVGASARAKRFSADPAIAS
jgi:hypothetical protein